MEGPPLGVRQRLQLIKSRIKPQRVIGRVDQDATKIQDTIVMNREREVLT